MKSKRFLSISGQIFLHLLFWAIVLLFFMNFSILRPYCSSTAEIEILYVLMIALICYLNQFVLYPRYFKKKQVKYWGSLLLLISLISIIEILPFLENTDHYFFFSNKKSTIFITFFITISLRNTGIILFSLFFRHYQEVKKNLKKEIQILKKEIIWYNEKREIEKKFIRSKIATHFLYNIINYMIVCASEQKDNLPYLLRKLASILDYYMVEASKESVEISDELNFYRNFIELENYRYEEKIKTSFQTTKEPETMKIAPLLFESFIANAFKYAPRDGSGYIQIKFSFTKTNRILFTCVNNKRKNNYPNDVSSKSGMKTVLNRLNLLYEDNYSFQIQEDDKLFKVTLHLDLTAYNSL